MKCPWCPEGGNVRQLYRSIDSNADAYGCHDCSRFWVVCPNCAFNIFEPNLNLRRHINVSPRSNTIAGGYYSVDEIYNRGGDVRELKYYTCGKCDNEIHNDSYHSTEEYREYVQKRTEPVPDRQLYICPHTDKCEQSCNCAFDHSKPHSWQATGLGSARDCLNTKPYVFCGGKNPCCIKLPIHYGCRRICRIKHYCPKYANPEEKCRHATEHDESDECNNATDTCPVCKLVE